MVRKTFNIFIIAVLALNLMGAWVFASLLDCGMECCRPGEMATAGTPVYQALTCCQLDGVTCGYEAGQYEELFDKAVCCFSKTVSGDQTMVMTPADDDILSFADWRAQAVAQHGAGPPLTVPVYLSNATFLC